MTDEIKRQVMIESLSAISIEDFKKYLDFHNEMYGFKTFKEVLDYDMVCYQGIGDELDPSQFRKMMDHDNKVLIEEYCD